MHWLLFISQYCLSAAKAELHCFSKLHRFCFDELLVRILMNRMGVVKDDCFEDRTCLSMKEKKEQKAVSWRAGVYYI